MDPEKVLEESRYHEAGHAVAAHYNGYLVLRVVVNEEETVTHWRGDAPTTWANCWRRACVTMAGQLADQRGAWGEIRPESWEEFREAAEDALDAGDDERGDHVEILEDLDGMADDPEESYRVVVRDARALVEEHWGEISAVARALERTGTLDGSEVVRIIEASAPPKGGIAMDHERDELRGRRMARLSPAGRELLAEIEGAVDDPQRPDPEEFVGRIGALPPNDQADMMAILSSIGNEAGAKAEEHGEMAEMAERAADAIERAQAIQYAAGETVDESMTVAEALILLESHGEATPEIDVSLEVDVPTPPTGRARVGRLDAEGAMQWESAPTTWQIEGHAHGDEPNPLASPDEAGEQVVSNLEVRVNDVGPHVPVRAEIYRHADRETVLRMLDKIRAHVEEYWEAR